MCGSVSTTICHLRRKDVREGGAVLGRYFYHFESYAYAIRIYSDERDSY